MPRSRASGPLGALCCSFMGAALVLAGCAGPSPQLAEGEPTRMAELPSYEALYEGAERRIATLDRLWAIAVVGLRYVDEAGERRREQGEGHFQMVRPSQLALFVGKLGEPYLILGSDESSYWWIERLDRAVATVGLRAEAAGLAAESIGVPVLPSDLLIAMDLERWPVPDDWPSTPSVGWSEHPGVDRSRTAAVTMVGPERVRRVHVDVFTLDPVAVEVMTSAGDPIALSMLSQHDAVANRIGAAVQPRMPMRIDVDVPAAEARLELSLKRAEMSDRRPRPIAFDLEELLERFRVREIRRVGSQPFADLGTVD